jgi:hypothetical protein
MAIPPEGMKLVWHNEEVQQSLTLQDAVIHLLVDINPVNSLNVLKAKADCITWHGFLLTNAQHTEEG